MIRRIETRLFRGLLKIAFACVFAFLHEQSQGAGTPVKIDLVEESPSSSDGAIRLLVNLLDAENQPAAANKEFRVDFEGKMPSGAVQKASIAIKPGEKSAVIELPTQESGIVTWSASNRELARGGILLNVQSTNSGEPETATSPSPAPSPQPEEVITADQLAPIIDKDSSITRSLNDNSKRRDSAISIDRNKPPVRITSKSVSPAPVQTDKNNEKQPETHPEHVTPVLKTIQQAASFVPIQPLVSPSRSSTPGQKFPASDWTPSLVFNYYPNRKLWADQTDSATIYACLSGDRARWDMSIYVMSDIGPTSPAAIVIPKGQNMGKATLVADRPGKISVRYLSSEPWAQVSGVPLTIDFGPPVAALRITANPAVFGLFDKPEISIGLVNGKDVTVPTDERRPVFLSIGSGRGEVDRSDLVIDANDSRTTTRFTPSWPGAVTVIATSPYLQDARYDLRVLTPTLLLILCGVGGAIGGTLAFVTNKRDAKWQRIPIGLVTGFVLYWALLFGVLYIPRFPHAGLLNPLSAVVIPLFGGWLGTKVITLVLKQFQWRL